ncbi:GNAT family N-acetyltransferase [Clostridium sp. MSJ-8]|uniref:GNAT family N-acetyltransferase n=1 Tax=Clostridium sp. MSJ-8 TaxID=2841510 RepID=UPI001C0F00B3|nr:GNAT family N-acetyltransferase [Clostridium sp. MSJ-8]MBU5487665.1 GNAT family N-acetyltransferase [Clostridium sp. MSJ-8]
MLKLEKKDYAKVNDLFKELNYNVVINSIIKGNAQGEIYVDNIKAPKVAIVWNNVGDVLIGGDSSDEVANRSIDDLIKNVFIPQVIKLGVEVSRIEISYTENFEGKLKVLKDKASKDVVRNVYKFNKLKVNPLSVIPRKFELVEIHENVLRNNKLEHLEKLKGWINTFWNSEEEFLKNGIGYCLVKDNVIVSFCISAYTYDEKVEFVLKTSEIFRGRGFGKSVASACVEKAVKSGKQVEWQCDNDNVPATRLADSLGFEIDFRANSKLIALDEIERSQENLS